MRGKWEGVVDLIKLQMGRGCGLGQTANEKGLWTGKIIKCNADPSVTATFIKTHGGAPSPWRAGSSIVCGHFRQAKVNRCRLLLKLLQASESKMFPVGI